MTTSSLDSLAWAAQQGDQHALEELVRGLQDPLYRVAFRFLGVEMARDATQEILILVITHLSSFRGDSSVMTWAYRIAIRHLLRQRSQAQRYTFEELEADLGQPPDAIESSALATAEERLLEEEVFLGCTQAMLLALDPASRIAFVLGAVLELEAAEAAAILEISAVTFRKRLSRARGLLDAFMTKNCGAANADAKCRCVCQVNLGMARGRLDPRQLRFAAPTPRTSLEALRAFAEIEAVKRSLELYRAQPELRAPEDFASRVRDMFEKATVLRLA